MSGSANGRRPMKYGYLDEAGDVGRTEGASRHLIVALVVVAHPEPLRKSVSRTRKSLGKKLKQIPEFKAKHTPKRITAKLLRRVVGAEVEIVAAILDKQQVTQPEDPEDWYRGLCAQVIQQCIARHPTLHLVMDQRYTNPTLRQRLVEAIVGEITLQHAISFEHADSTQEKAIQVADAVAWALFQKYEWGDDDLYQIIEEKIVVEKMVRE